MRLHRGGAPADGPAGLSAGSTSHAWKAAGSTRGVHGLQHDSANAPYEFQAKRRAQAAVAGFVVEAPEGCTFRQISEAGGELSLPLIAKFETQDAASGGELAKWRVALDPKMALLFGKSSYTLLDWEQRLKLSAGLASWLHGYFASHAVPGRVKLSTLQRASGSQTVASRKFAQLVRAALEELKAAKFLVYGEVRGDLVIVLRAPCA